LKETGMNVQVQEAGPAADAPLPPVAPQRASANEAVTERDTPSAPDRDVEQIGFRTLDHICHTALASTTSGISPISLLLAWQDWFMHLSIAPGKQFDLLRKRVRKNLKLADFLSSYALKGDRAQPCIEPLPQDHRFSHPGWRQWPFNAMEQSFLLTQQWWHNATTGVAGVGAHHERLAEFYSRQILDMVSPSNFLPTNPEVIEATLAEGGANLIRGFGHFLDDAQDLLRQEKTKPLAFEPGRDVAVTPGEVVFRNELIELIQYRPATPTVRAEPILIIPAWIMKYYILDLSPENSLVRYMVGQGFTVFCISWINPDARHRGFGLDDYLQLGVMAALDAVGAICGSGRVHAVGYCLGGTLLSIAAAAMARDGDDRLNTLTLLAAQVDFDEPGELGLFIDESQLTFLEDMMWQKGFLDQWQMAGAFEMLRSQDLVWSRMVRDYLMGDRQSPNDLMSWNADATRMPFRMHSEYLRQLYLGNDLSQGRFKVGDEPVHLEDIRLPVFAVGTVTDHVAPWKSVFKLIHLFDTDVEFVLTSGGHNAGIVSEPGHAHRSFRRLTYRWDSPHPDPETWAKGAEEQAGSWWPEWAAWLASRSGDNRQPPPMGRAEAGYKPICAAPGTYVHLR
jgi:polyhydroxyalkanoate synthase